jgi:hypothetical protein
MATVPPRGSLRVSAISGWAISYGLATRPPGLLHRVGDHHPALDLQRARPNHGHLRGDGRRLRRCLCRAALRQAALEWLCSFY